MKPMLPLPPVIVWTLAALGAAALAKVLGKEWQRVNAELDAHERAAEHAAREHIPTLRRDPRTGVYRPE
jgi:hypothetical protein